MLKLLLVVAVAAGPLAADTLRLAAAQELLFKNNPDVLVSVEEAAKARTELSDVYTGYWPSLDATGSYNYLTEKSRLKLQMEPFFPGTDTIVIDRELGANDKAECGLNLSYPLFTGFQRYYAVAGKKENIAMKDAALETVKNRMSLTLGLLYLQWELSHKQVGLRRMLVDQIESLAKQLTDQREAGTILSSRLLEAQARLQLARLDVLTAIDLCDSLGLEIQSMLLLKDNALVPDPGSVLAFDTLPVPKAPKKTRPELVSFDHADAQVDAQEALLRYRHFPIVSGLAGLRYGRPGLYLGRDAYMGYGLVGVQAQWNLFDGFKTRTQRELIARQRNFIDIERTRQIEQFARLFRLAGQQLKSAGGRLVATEIARDAARALAEDGKNALAAGTITNAEYLNALVNLAQAELLVEQVRTLKKTAFLKVLYTAGMTIKYQ